MLIGQLRLAEEGKYVPKIRPRGKLTVDPVVTKLGIDINIEKPALLHRSENDHKKPERLAFPRIASQPRKIQDFHDKYGILGLIKGLHLAPVIVHN